MNLFVGIIEKQLTSPSMSPQILCKHRSVTNISRWKIQKKLNRRGLPLLVLLDVKHRQEVNISLRLHTALTFTRNLANTNKSYLAIILERILFPIADLTHCLLTEFQSIILQHVETVNLIDR